MPVRRAVTLIRVLIVVAVIGILVGLLIPAVYQVRHIAAHTSCHMNMKQIALSTHSYLDNNNAFPPGTVAGTLLPPDQRLSFYVLLIPFIESTSLHNELDFKQSWDSPRNIAVVENGRWMYVRCPQWMEELWEPAPGQEKTDRGYLAPANYIGVAGVGADAPTLPDDHPRIGMFGYDRRLKVDQIKDGLANTAVFVETGRDVGPWIRGGPATVRGIDPADVPITGAGRPFGGTHMSAGYTFRWKQPVGSNVALGDGSVRFLTDAADPAILTALATVAGGEPIPEW